MAAYVVAVPAIQLTVGSRMFFLERGAAVPQDADPDRIAWLEENGYIAILDEVEPETGEVDQSADVPPVDEKPLEEMTVAELDELAEAEGIDLAGATRKADKVAAIGAARASEPTEPVDAGSNL